MMSLVFEAKFCNLEFSGSPPMSVLDRGSESSPGSFDECRLSAEMLIAVVTLCDDNGDGVVMTVTCNFI